MNLCVASMIISVFAGVFSVIAMVNSEIAARKAARHEKALRACVNALASLLEGNASQAMMDTKDIIHAGNYYKERGANDLY